MNIQTWLMTTFKGIGVFSIITTENMFCSELRVPYSRGVHCSDCLLMKVSL